MVYGNIDGYDSLNNALFALGASCSRQIQNNRSIAFDFWVRVSFVRQALLALGEDERNLTILLIFIMIWGYARYWVMYMLM